MNWLKTRLVIVFLVLAVVGVMLTIGGVSDIIKMNGEISVLNFDDVNDIKKGDIVGAYVWNIYGSYASETTTNSTMGVETSSYTSRQYYVMGVFQDDTEDSELYMTISASKDEDIYMLETISDFESNNDDWDAHPDYIIYAKAKKLDSELNNYLIEGIEEWDLYGSRAEIQEHIVPFEFAIFNPDTAYTNLVIGLVILAVVIVVVFIFIAKTRPKKLNEVPGYVQGTPAYGGAGDTQSNAGGFAEESHSPQNLPYISQPVQPDDFFAKPEKKSVQSEPRQPAEKPQEKVQADSSYSDANIDTANLNTEQSLYEQEQTLAANKKQVEYTNNLDTSDLDSDKGLYEQEQAVAANKKQVEYTNTLDTSDINAEQSLYEQEQIIAANAKQVEYTNNLDTSELDADKGLYEQEQAVAANKRQVEYTNEIDTSELDTDSLEYFDRSSKGDDDDIFEFDNDSYSGEVNADDIEIT